MSRQGARIRLLLGRLRPRPEENKPPVRPSYISKVEFWVKGCFKNIESQSQRRAFGTGGQGEEILSIKLVLRHTIPGLQKEKCGQFRCLPNYVVVHAGGQLPLLFFEIFSSSQPITRSSLGFEEYSTVSYYTIQYGTIRRGTVNLPGAI